MSVGVDGPGWPVEELAARVGLPVRTIREYQTMRVLEPPARRGRVAFYGEAHLRRLALIARLQERGYSLAGIRDLLEAWAAGGDLAGILSSARTEHLPRKLPSSSTAKGFGLPSRTFRPTDSAS
jgi:DNA-binding transcriptional MerR regulator